MITEWSYVGRALEKLWRGFLAALKDDTSDPLAFTLRCCFRGEETNLIYADQVSDYSLNAPQLQQDLKKMIH